ncbi:hypothetical protein ACFQ9X_08365 [Catenulispora yoronensis]
MEGKYRKNDRRPTPARATMSSIVVASKPRSPNSATAAATSASRIPERASPRLGARPGPEPGAEGSGVDMGGR